MSSYYEKILATGEVKCIDDEIPFEIPATWNWARLSNITSILGDGIHGTPEYDATGTVYFINGNNLSNGSIEIKADTKKVSEQEAEKHKRLLNSTTVLVSINGTLGNVAFYNGENVILGKSACYFNLMGNIDKQYIKHILETEYFTEYAKNVATGSTIKNVPLAGMRNFLIPVPPITEQHRIILGMVRLAHSIDRYNDAQTKLDLLNNVLNEKLKKSVLQEAIQGKLVPQLAEEGTAQELLEQIKAEKEKLVKEGKLKKSALNNTVIFRGDDNKYYTINRNEKICIDDEIPFDIPDTWEWCRLGTLFSHCTGKALNASNIKGQLMTYITTSNLYWDRFELGNIKQMRFTDEEIEKCTATFGDLLVCEGGDVGRAAIWNYPYDIRIQNHIHKLRAYKQLCTKFFFWVFYFYKAIGRIGGKGIGIQGLSSKALDNILIPLPPLKEQQRIVAQIEKLFEQLH